MRQETHQIFCPVDAVPKFFLQNEKNVPPYGKDCQNVPWRLIVRVLSLNYVHSFSHTHQ